MLINDFMRDSGMQARIDEHQKFLDKQSQSTGLGMVGGALRSIVGTLGLAAEAPTTIGKVAAGTVYAAIGEAQPGFSELTDKAYLDYVASGGKTEGGELGKQFSATLAGHEGAASKNKYLTGAADMLFDPSNVIPIGPANKLKEVKGLRGVAREAAGAVVSPELLADGSIGRYAEELITKSGMLSTKTLASPIEEQLANIALTFANQGSGEKAAKNVAKSALESQKAREKLAKPAVKQIGEAAKLFGNSGEEAAGNMVQSQFLSDAGENLLLDRSSYGNKGERVAALSDKLGTAQDKTINAEMNKGIAPEVYRRFKGQQKDAIQSLVAEGDNPLSAKSWIEEMSADWQPPNEGMRNPKKGENYGQYLDEHNQVYQRLRHAEGKLEQSINEALNAPDYSNMTQAQADALVGPEALQLADMAQSSSPAIKGKFNKVVRESDSAGLSNLNERFNALENQDMLSYTPQEAESVGLTNFAAQAPTPAPVVPTGAPSFDSVNQTLSTPGVLPAAAFANVTAPTGTPQALKQTVEAVVNAVPVPTQPGMEPLVLAKQADDGTYIGRMGELIRFAFAEAKKSQMEAFGRDRAGVGATIKALPGLWAGITTQTVRNVLQDEAFVRLMLGHEGIGQGAYNTAQKIITRRLALGETNEALLFGGMGDLAGIHGWPEALGTVDEAGMKKINLEFSKNIGGSAWELELENATQLNAMEQLIGNTIIGLANPVRAATNVLLMPLGALSEARGRAFKIINNVTHLAGRSLAFENAYVPFMDNSAKALLAAAEAEGRNVSALRGLPIKGVGRSAADGGFGAREVAEALGERYAKEWEGMVAQGREAGFNEAKRVFGDFSNKKAPEKAVGMFMPFMSWTWRAYPRVAQMVFEHPVVTAAVYQLYRAEGQVAKNEQRKDYQYGTLSINKDTKVLGILARVFTPEQESEIRFNPVSFFSPVSGDTLAALGGEGKDGGNTTVYQDAKNAANVIGGGFNPAIQTAAYVTGQDYQSPGPASRYAAIDNLMSQLTGGLGDVPTIQGVLRGARELTGNGKDTYDPVASKAKELVFQRTKEPLNSANNRALAAQVASKTGIYLEAQRLLDTGNATRSVFNATSPVSAMVNTATGEEIRKAKLGIPFSYDEIQKAKANNLPGIVAYMMDENTRYKRGTPAANATDKPAVIAPRTR